MPIQEKLVERRTQPDDGKFYHVEDDIMFHSHQRPEMAT